MTLSRPERKEAVVLLVEDEPILLNSLAKHLRRAGLTVLCAPSALHALQLLEMYRVDLVVSDLQMPGPSGLRLLETIRDGWPSVGRFLLTGYSSPEARESSAVDMILDKSEDAGFVIDSIVNEARRRNGKGR